MHRVLKYVLNPRCLCTRRIEQWCDNLRVAVKFRVEDVLLLYVQLSHHQQLNYGNQKAS